VKKGRIGQRFEDFLKEGGLYVEAHAVAIKRVIAFQLSEAMKAKNIKKAEMARRINTSRSQLNRLLDPKIGGVELQALARTARIVGRNLRLDLGLEGAMAILR
jgi:predicted XRE-type DNA-binding protein